MGVIGDCMGIHASASCSAESVGSLASSVLGFGGGDTASPFGIIAVRPRARGAITSSESMSMGFKDDPADTLAGEQPGSAA